MWRKAFDRVIWGAQATSLLSQSGSDFRLLAEILLRSASCRTQQAGSLRSPDVYFGAREATIQFVYLLQ